MMETIAREQRACNRDGSLSVIADMEHMQMYQQTYLPGRAEILFCTLYNNNIFVSF